MNNKQTGKSGAVFAAAAYILWGILPLYWKTLQMIDPFRILGFRISLSLVCVAAFLFFRGKARERFRWIGILQNPSQRRYLIVSAFMITCNWGLYIWAVNEGHTVECSLGYYINPLVSVMLGLLCFREKLSLLQWLAFAIACLGVALLTAFSGAVPWISLGLALTFAFYGLLKKKAAADSLESLGIETLLAFPLALALLIFPGDGLAELGGLSVTEWALLLLAGIITSVPLYLFAQGAKLLPLSALGFIQFLSPTFQFLIGVFVFRESLPGRNIPAYLCVWLAVILYSLSLMKRPLILLSKPPLAQKLKIK